MCFWTFFFNPSWHRFLRSFGCKSLIFEGSTTMEDPTKTHENSSWKTAVAIMNFNQLEAVSNVASLKNMVSTKRFNISNGRVAGVIVNFFRPLKGRTFSWVQDFSTVLHLNCQFLRCKLSTKKNTQNANPPEHTTFFSRGDFFAWTSSAPAKGSLSFFFGNVFRGHDSFFCRKLHWFHGFCAGLPVSGMFSHIPAAPWG